MPTPRPRDVPGYAEARRAGLLPLVGQVPPTLLPGRTAQDEFHRFLLRNAVAVAVIVVAFGIAAKVDGIARVILLLGPGLVCWWLIVFRFMAPVGVRNDDELAAGYTTFVMQFGTFRSGGRHWQTLSWDYRGTWILNQHGAVVSGPDHAFDAPGYYPSPNGQGAYELWTGAAWSGHYRASPVSTRGSA
jgi:predicted secreted protein